jgi:hypothetical protein
MHVRLWRIFFAAADIDSLVVQLASSITTELGPFQSLIKHLSAVYLTLGVPSYAYPLLGKKIVDALIEEKDGSGVSRGGRTGNDTAPS